MALVLPRTNAEDALAIAERVRGAIEALPDHPRVTVSAGVATYPLGASDAAALRRTLRERGVNPLLVRAFRDRAAS